MEPSVVSDVVIQSISPDAAHTLALEIYNVFKTDVGQFLSHFSFLNTVVIPLVCFCVLVWLFIKQFFISH